MRPRADDTLAQRLARSTSVRSEGAALRTADVAGWLAERARAHHFRVERIPLDALDSWFFAADTGNLHHRTGRFFSVEGLDVSLDEGAIRRWQQPIIRQPEVGILGILAKEFDGVLHFLMQAKMEPGNPNLLQLSPTVQATRSNYTGAHRGTPVKYLEYFTDRSRGLVLTDVLQSEHGSWFYRKSNRNIVVEAVDHVPVDDDFCWLTLGQIGELLRRDNVVNMDARTVLACCPVAPAEPGALHTDAELLSWFTVERSRHDVAVERVPLAGIDEWERGEHSIGRADGRYFRLVAVGVEAGNREVTGWSQPLFEPTSTGVAAFLVRRLAGVPHLLVQAKVEAGFLDTVELAPTVQCTPENWTHLPEPQRPCFLDVVHAADPDRIRYAAVHSEEGGRFLNAESNYLFVEADEAQAPLDPPTGFRWATPGQLNNLAQHGHYLNVQARTLLSCLNAGTVRLDHGV
ncbi:NDP-hexose 2,3-dehydratase family protein [Micromonospora sp. WMMA1363]|uniref:NDP-hexose 2,3-dehydratase family protein n=1 Tax=Micromonospora sp. WMMA1363 TaxID=3053985 RepID=UPI00259D13E8|nr:NDP-hexose 2,3-dehydratase family protein [Micromonospora sp. WMMA1363]MDM4722183.1 NDP-hexose 2,3-dehydratase family protein [Micromonospora sp. WMMA1363]